MSLPAGWTIPLRDPAVVREADRRAIEDEGIPGVELMRRAASGLAEAVMQLAPDGPVAILAGKGNNGGDGLAAARILADSGRTVLLYSTCGPTEWTGDAAAMLAELPGREPEVLPERLPADIACVVDCLLGTGASGAPRGAVAEAVRLVADARERGARVIACDVPTGVDAASGEVQGEAVTADLTVTFHCAKPGLWIGPGKERCGTVEVLDIGIPGDDGPWSVGLIEDSACVGLPQRGPEGDKFAAGAVIVAGGSPGLTGAPILAALGAARGGAGYVTVALPASLLQASDRIPEIMGLGLAEVEGSHCAEGVDALVERSRRAGAVVLGPGLGRSESAGVFARAVAEAVECPLVVDADAIHAFAEAHELLAARTAPTVITPHSGEMASLLGSERSTVEAGRLDAVRDSSARTRSVVVLKGDDTLVADPAGDVAVSRGGAPALATAGSGDVLGGLIGSLLARGVEPLLAAAAAVRLHCEAGRIAGERGSEGVLAGDVAAALPRARAQLTVGGVGR